ncbi:hypothetical protein F2Q70_00017888 [Brassica cretica]|uniref:Uncharacterized protein n=1 Tax=Brassica cretica TaxID=69181 RepID=A0A8S9HZH3_BRACR|nr:hypothetical protein F2Q70_00017888 [Brassica cretica]
MRILLVQRIFPLVTTEIIQIRDQSYQNPEPNGAHSDWLRVIPSTVVCACEETSGKGMEVTTPIPKERIILVAAMEIAFWLVRRRDFRSISREEEEKEAGVCKG